MPMLLYKRRYYFAGFRFWSSSSLGSIFTLQHSWQTIFLMFCWCLCHFIWCL